MNVFYATGPTATYVNKLTIEQARKKAEEAANKGTPTIIFQAFEEVKQTVPPLVTTPFEAEETK